jgi:hypothetical protein
LEEEAEGLGEPEADGTSRLGREDEVGVMMAEFARRGKGAAGSRGEAMVDMVGSWIGGLSGF